MTQSSDTLSSRTLGVEYARDVWRRRKWLCVAVFFLVFAVMATITLSLPNLYAGTTTVLVERRQVPEEFVKSSVTDELETRIQMIQQQVMSRARLSDLIDRLGLYRGTRRDAPLDKLADQIGLNTLFSKLRKASGSSTTPTDAYVERMRREVQLVPKSVEQVGGHSLTIAFGLSYSGRDPEIVANVANTLASSYISENMRSRERQVTETAAFLKEQLNTIKQDLDARQRRMSSYKIGFNDQLQPVEVNLTTLERLNTQLRMNNDAQLRLMERRQVLEQQVNELETGGPPSVTAATPATPVAQLSKAKQELAALRQRFSDVYPDVVRKQAEVTELERQVAALGPAGETPVVPPPKATMKLLKDSIAEVDRQKQVLKQEEASVRQMIGKYQTSVEGSPRRQQVMQGLSREFDETNERYQTLAKRYEEAQLSENLEQGRNPEQFSILDAAIPPPTPAAPNRPWLLLVSLLSSAGLALAAAVAAEKLDSTFHTTDDLRSFTNLPTLATIRRVPTHEEMRQRRMRFVVVTLIVAIAIVVLTVGAYEFASGNEQIVRLMMRPAA